MQPHQLYFLAKQNTAARLAQHQRGGTENLKKLHIYSIQRDPRTFEFAAGMGMDGTMETALAQPRKREKEKLRRQ
jgi:hypothetical protein